LRPRIRNGGSLRRSALRLKLAVAGVVSWSTAAQNEEGCGGLTGVTPLVRYRAWIVERAARMNSPLAP
jgi:hypothetical protein